MEDQECDSKSPTKCDTSDSETLVVDETKLDVSDPDGEDSDGVQNMFASVWVKVEVNDEDSKGDDLEENVNHLEQVKKPTHYIRSGQRLQCDQCAYTTTFKTCMQRHVMGHLNIKPFVCTECPYAAAYPESLQRHLNKHLIDKDENATKYYCDTCEYSTHYKYSLRAHKRKHSLEKMYKCTQCSYSTAYRGSYVKHMKMHKRDPKLYKCDKCPFTTKYPGHIYRHRATIHHVVTGDANYCSFCDFSTVVRWRLNQHVMRSRQEKVLQCRQCDFETYYMCESRKHKSEHQQRYGVGTVCIPKIVEAQQEMTSEINDNQVLNNVVVNNTESVEETTNINEQKTKKTKKSTKKSKNTSKVTKNSIIDKNTTNDTNNSTNAKVTKTEDEQIIDNEFDTKSIKVLQSGDSDKPFQCSKCSYTSRLKAPVQRHYRRHHTSHNRPYKCTNCDFSTKTKDQLHLHNKRSQSDLVLDCNSCSFSTKYKCVLVLHQKEHYEHKCTMCSYSCKNRSEIQRHFNVVHLGGGLKCRFCNFRSARKESVMCHEMIHTGEKPFKCTFCDYKTVRNSLLTIHFRKHHGGMDTF